MSKHTHTNTHTHSIFSFFLYYVIVRDPCAVAHVPTPNEEDRGHVLQQAGFRGQKSGPDEHE